MYRRVPYWGRSRSLLFLIYVNDIENVNNCGELNTVYRRVPYWGRSRPLLFLIYVNDIENVNNCGELNLFADDTTMCVFGSNVNEIMAKSNDALSRINLWFTAK